MPQLYANNAYSALASGITAVATSLTLASGTGVRFPSISGGDYFLLTLADVSGGSESAWEIVKVTARATDTLTIVRAQEGTTGSIWASGTPVDLRITKGSLATLVDGTAIGVTTPSTGAFTSLTASKVVFGAEASTGATTGSINIDWSANNHYVQAEPTGTITYTFTAPTGPCRLQLRIESDGTSTAQTINFPSITQYGTSFAAVNNKKAVLSFWYDGANYHLTNSNQV